MTYRPYSTFVNPAIEYVRTNTTGVTINAGTPVIMNSSGDPDFVNVSIEAEVISIAAVAQDTVSNGDEGVFVTSGRVKELNVAFDFGDTIYISKTGGLTNVQPAVGVGGFVDGDFIVMLGVIARNEDNASLKDLILHIDIMGQL